MSSSEKFQIVYPERKIRDQFLGGISGDPMYSAFESYYQGYWSDHEEDMQRFSTMHPTVMFCLEHLEHDDEFELGRKWFHDGKMIRKDKYIWPDKPVV